jgi:hypothetical protein
MRAVPLEESAPLGGEWNWEKEGSRIPIPPVLAGTRGAARVCEFWKNSPEEYGRKVGGRREDTPT